jgi:hypothetical protein
MPEEIRNGWGSETRLLEGFACECRLGHVWLAQANLVLFQIPAELEFEPLSRQEILTSSR